MDFSDWGSNAGKSDGGASSSSILSPSALSTHSSMAASGHTLHRIDESAHEDHPPPPPAGGGGRDHDRKSTIRRAQSSSSDNNPAVDHAEGRGAGDAGQPRRLESVVSFAEDEPVEAIAVEVRGERHMMSLAERARGGSSPGVTRR